MKHSETRILTTHTGSLPRPEGLVAMLGSVSRGDPTRVLAGTDCGFDTSAGSNRVDAGIVWLKLRAMREGADIASRELF